jgi:hypothetical protein
VTIDYTDAIPNPAGLPEGLAVTLSRTVTAPTTPTVQGPVGDLARGGTTDEALAMLPLRGAGLITQVIRFDRSALEISLAQFLDDFSDDPASEEAGTISVPYPLLVASGLAAFEATRRWHERKETARKKMNWTALNPGLSGLS